MNRAKFERTALLAGTAALALLTPACYVTTNGSSSIVEHDARTVDLKGAKSVRLEIEMGAGELVMHGGAATLMDADFRYRHSNGKPEVQYDISGTQGTLTVRQPPHHGIGGNDKNQWDLRLNEDVPMDVTVKMGAGQGRLDLGNTALHSLDVDVGAGEMKVDLTGHPRGDIDVRVRGGVGEATVRLPRRARLDVEAHGGIGEISARGLTKRGDRWVNEPTGESPATLHVNVSGGIGQINLICE
ncbi:MAG TPA: toast rack family protein [Bryobacteraceae bacterium]|nr:toast rack family protein [Bryobacteraceae bacterium]